MARTTSRCGPEYAAARRWSALRCSSVNTTVCGDFCAIATGLRRPGYDSFKLAAYLGRRPLRWDGSVNDQELARLQSEAGEAQAKAAELKTRREQRESAIGDAAAIEVDRAAALATLASFENTREAVRIARQHIREAAADAYRGVAPHLNRALADKLAAITRGRYAEAKVDENLLVTVKTPETGQFVDIVRLSRGTQDQIALVERLELARSLHPAGEGAPLLLDDCFAHTDKHRLNAAIRILIAEAEQRQIILFTDSDLVTATARNVSPNVEVIELADPVR